MNLSDKKNPRRLIRAIEIAEYNRVKNKIDEAVPVFDENEVLIIGLKTSMDSLKKRIKKRVEERIKQGALKEAKKMFENYERLAPQLKAANGYKQMFDYLQNNISYDEAITQWGITDYKHARAQMTYFKKMNVRWVDIERKGFEDEILRLVKHELGLPILAKASVDVP